MGDQAQAGPQEQENRRQEPPGAQQPLRDAAASSRLPAVVLLAAGESARMGTPKQLLRLHGTSLLRRAAQTALASACRPVVVVLGARDTEMRPELDGLDVAVVHNPDWQQGMGSSLRVGVREVGIREEPSASLQADGAEASPSLIPNPPSPWVSELRVDAPLIPSLIVMLCDQPFVTPQLLRQLHQTWQHTGAKIVACEYGGDASGAHAPSPGVPALFARSVWPDLLALPNVQGAKALFGRYAGEMARVPFEAGAVDVDTPDAWNRLLAQMDEPLQIHEPAHD